MRTGLAGTLHRSRQKRRKRLDALAGKVVHLGGLVILLSITSILFFMLKEVWPLWQSPRVEPELQGIAATDGTGILAAGTHESRDILYTLGQDGDVSFLDGKGNLLSQEPAKVLSGATVAVRTGAHSYFVADKEGNVHGLKVLFTTSWDSDQKSISYKVMTTPDVVRLTEDTKPLSSAPRNLAVWSGGDNVTAAAILADNSVVAVAKTVTKSLFGAGTVKASYKDLTAGIGGKATAIALSPDGQNLVVATDEGALYHWQVARGKVIFNSRLEAADKQGMAITSLGFLLGGKSLMVGRTDGSVAIWLPVSAPDTPTGRTFHQAREFPGTGHPVESLIPSPRNRGFIAVDAVGNMRALHGTSGRVLATWQAGGPLAAVAYAPKGNGAVGVRSDGDVYTWRVNIPHPEISFGTLFGKVWYEGYDKPEYVWQSTGGTDDFEPKFSLVPLLFGTLKGALYAALLAFPIAVLAAIYTSQFMAPRLRSVIKPAIEMMASIPSVVLGFLGGLWLAPLVGRNVPGTLLVLAVIPISILIAHALWRLVPVKVRNGLPSWTETVVSLPVTAIGLVVALGVGSLLQDTAFGGDFGFWLFQQLGSQYELRNAIIVGIAMAFAVIPIVYTISEDALSSVPRTLVAGSLALGANRWQTAWHVMVPTALPGIFAASMVGLGRAVGETMIVLMATGNTPITSWLPFNGFRAMSANIAVEMPEAPVGGTLYRVLFLTALLLFAITFLVNTAAELVRLRMRRRVSQL